MTHYVMDSQGLSSVTLRSLYAYLKSHGWQKIEQYGDAGDIFGQDTENLELLVPSKVLADYQRRIGDILEVLSEFEERDVLTILQDISISEYDLIRVRLIDPAGSRSVPVADGVSLFQESRNLLLAAACSASRPQRAYRAGRIQDASDYMTTVRLGQTEIGSYIVRLLSPVPPNLLGQADFSTRMPPEPFSRKVTRKLVSGLRSVREAVTSADRGSGISAFERNVSRGVSANLCDALANILHVENRQHVDITVSWSLVREPPEGRAQIGFRASDTSVLQEASRILKDRQERPNELLDGYVYALARGQADHSGRTTLKAIV